MKKFISMSLALVMIVSCLVGCGTSDGTDSSVSGNSATSSSETSEQAKKTVLNTALNSAASTSDPFAHSNLVERVWHGNVFEPLFHYNASSGEFDPYVGESFSVSDDGLEYTVKIKDNVYFHNGDHCTADDILYSLEYAAGSSFTSSYVSCIESAEKVDDYTVVITLSFPNSVFSNNMGRIFVINKNVVEEQGENFGKTVNLAGTGPYYIDTYEPDTKIVLKAFDKYHEGKASIETINFNVITDASSRLLAFESGELDFIEVPVSNWEEVKNSGQYETLEAETSNVQFVFINELANAALGNKQVRQAIGYAIDYDSMIKIGCNGMGIFSGKMMNPSLTIAAPDGGIVYKYDVEKAKKLLAEAGYADGVDVGVLKVPNDSICIKCAQIFESCLSDIGIKVTIETMESSAATQDYLKKNYDIGLLSCYYQVDYDKLSPFINDKDNPNGSIISLSKSKTIDGERVFELFEEGRSVSDISERKAIYTEIDDIMMDGAVILPLYSEIKTYAWSKDLTIKNTMPTYTYMLQWFYGAEFK